MEIVQHPYWIIFHDLVRLAAIRITEKIIIEGLQNAGDMAVTPLIEHLGEIFPKDDRRSLQLAHRKIGCAIKDDNIGKSALHAMQRMHDRDSENAAFPFGSDRKQQFDSLSFEQTLIDAQNVAEEIDFDSGTVDFGEDQCGLWSMVVRRRNADLAIQGVGELLRSLALPEIVYVLGRVRPIGREFVNMGISLGPQVKRLATHDESMIA